MLGGHEEEVYCCLILSVDIDRLLYSHNYYIIHLYMLIF